MKSMLLAAAATIALSAPALAQDKALADAVAADYPYVFELYKHFHQNPELSFKESASAARMATELKALGFTVTTGVGDKWTRSEEHTSELQSQSNLVCRLLLEKKK